jgi:hypothetical protein
MSTLQLSTDLVARCGLYCGACKAYLKGKCAGCEQNEKATWCKVRSCCSEKGIATCADCTEFADPNDCRKFNNIVSRIFGLIFKSDRAACIEQVRRLGVKGHAAAMAEAKVQTIRRGSRPR